MHGHWTYFVGAQHDSPNCIFFATAPSIGAGRLEEFLEMNRSDRNNGTPTRKPVAAEQPEPDRIVLSVREAAWELHCSPNTVGNLVRDGTLPSFKLGRRRLIARTAIQEFIDRGGTEVR
jgi:excisionase family DNA binding protein